MWAPEDGHLDLKTGEASASVTDSLPLQLKPSLLLVSPEDLFYRFSALL